MFNMTLFNQDRNSTRVLWDSVNIKSHIGYTQWMFYSSGMLNGTLRPAVKEGDYIATAQRRRNCPFGAQWYKWQLGSALGKKKKIKHWRETLNMTSQPAAQRKHQFSPKILEVGGKGHRSRKNEITSLRHRHSREASKSPNKTLLRRDINLWPWIQHGWQSRH